MLQDFEPVKMKCPYCEGGPRHNGIDRNGTSIPGTDLLKTVLDSQDMFVIEVFKDSDGRYQMIFQGFGWKGTYAAGKYFNEIVCNSLSAYDSAWIIVRWQDSNGDGFVNSPSDGDTYTVIGTG